MASRNDSDAAGLRCDTNGFLSIVSVGYATLDDALALEHSGRIETQRNSQSFDIVDANVPLSTLD